MMHFQGTQKPNIIKWLLTFKFSVLPTLHWVKNNFTFYFSKQPLVLIKSLSKGGYTPLGDKGGGVAHRGDTRNVRASHSPFKMMSLRQNNSEKNLYSCKFKPAAIECSILHLIFKGTLERKLKLTKHKTKNHTTPQTKHKTHSTV